jgi:16S rRNA G527 N7-methylase RsmG
MQQHTPVVVSRAVAVLTVLASFTNTLITANPSLFQESWTTKYVSQTRETPNCLLKFGRNEISKTECLETTAWVHSA